MSGSEVTIAFDLTERPGRKGLVNVFENQSN